MESSRWGARACTFNPKASTGRWSKPHRKWANEKPARVFQASHWSISPSSDEARGARWRHRVARVPIGAWIGRRGEIRARREAWYGRRSSTTHTYRHLCCARLLAVLITRCGAVLRSGEHRGRERDQGTRARATSRSTTCDTAHTRVRFRNHGSLDPSHGHGESVYSWLRGPAQDGAGTAVCCCGVTAVERNFFVGCVI